MEEVGLRDVAYNTGNMLKHVEFSVNMARPEFGMGHLGGGIAQRSIYILILPVVLVVRRDTISKFPLWTITPKTDIPLQMM